MDDEKGFVLIHMGTVGVLGFNMIKHTLALIRYDQLFGEASKYEEDLYLGGLMLLAPLILLAVMNRLSGISKKWFEKWGMAASIIWALSMI